MMRLHRFDYFLGNTKPFQKISSYFNMSPLNFMINRFSYIVKQTAPLRQCSVEADFVGNHLRQEGNFNRMLKDVLPVTCPVMQPAQQVDQFGVQAADADIDRRLLLAIIEKFDGGPVGLYTLAAALSEEPDTIMDVVEPYLLQLGFLDRTARGRVATRRAYEHLGIEYPEKPEQPRLF